jgi:ABC-type polar amino acid transport system ATPase subunit
LLGDKDITNLPPEKRNISTVFQNYALFQNMSVKQNVAYGLKIRKMSKDVIDQKCKEYLSLVRMEAYADKGIDELSGGQQQRVAIARALMLSPDILCFDEPTSALDPELTGEVLKVIRSLKDSDRTMIIVTHEMEFAKNVADKVIFVADGVIEEAGTPEEVLENPKSEKVRHFLSVLTKE